MTTDQSTLTLVASVSAALFCCAFLRIEVRLTKMTAKTGLPGNKKVTILCPGYSPYVQAEILKYCNLAPAETMQCGMDSVHGILSVEVLI